MRLKSKLTSALAVGAALTAMAGFSVAHAGAASADPHAIYVAVGSDTTQDVLNQFALDEKGNLIASYNATNPVSQNINEIITPNNAAGGQCNFTRPNDSSLGLFALEQSNGDGFVNIGNFPILPSPVPAANCVDFARSSDAPSPANANPNGVAVYIPFGVDALAGSYGSNGNLAADAAALSALTLVNPGSSASGDLVNLYKNCASVTEGGVTFNPNAGGNIDLYVPPVNSSTRNFFPEQLGIPTNAALPACVHDNLQANNASNPGITCPAILTPVEADDGTAVTCDPNGYMPFSVAQFVGQNNGHNPRFHHALLTAVNNISPCNGGSLCGANASLNTGATMVREVFNVFPYAKVCGAGAGADPTLDQLFVLNSATCAQGVAHPLICSDTATILSYGFGRLPGPLTDACGSTTQRALASW